MGTEIGSAAPSSVDPNATLSIKSRRHKRRYGRLLVNVRAPQPEDGYSHGNHALLITDSHYQMADLHTEGVCPKEYESTCTEIGRPLDVPEGRVWERGYGPHWTRIPDMAYRVT
jgi:hypothetical protein